MPSKAHPTPLLMTTSNCRQLSRSLCVVLLRCGGELSFRPPDGFRGRGTRRRVDGDIISNQISLVCSINPDQDDAHTNDGSNSSAGVGDARTPALVNTLCRGRITSGDSLALRRGQSRRNYTNYVNRLNVGAGQNGATSPVKQNRFSKKLKWLKGHADSNSGGLFWFLSRSSIPPVANFRNEYCSSYNADHGPQLPRINSPSRSWAAFRRARARRTSTSLAQQRLGRHGRQRPRYPVWCWSECNRRE